MIIIFIPQTYITSYWIQFALFGTKLSLLKRALFGDSSNSPLHRLRAIDYFAREVIRSISLRFYFLPFFIKVGDETGCTWLVKRQRAGYIMEPSNFAPARCILYIAKGLGLRNRTFIVFGGVVAMESHGRTRFWRFSDRLEITFLSRVHVHVCIRVICLIEIWLQQ